MTTGTNTENKAPRKRSRKLRSGYTTGACAAAAAKGAALLLLGLKTREVDIPFPDGRRVAFALSRTRSPRRDAARPSAFACVLKDAGDDPDVTNGAEICARVAGARAPHGAGNPRVHIRGGDGVGTVTKPGLAVSVGEPAINPVPLRMIREAVTEALESAPPDSLPFSRVDVTISVPRGEELARRTLNARLGIVGGISILGTTGIVRPISAEAWTATITASMDVARAAGIDEVVLSTGRTSERALQRRLGLPEEAYVMMGDYLSFACRDAAAHGFTRVHLAAMWAKTVKAALGITQTHVRHGALEPGRVLALLDDLGAGSRLLRELARANTGREIFEYLEANGRGDLVGAVLERARQFAVQHTGGGPAVTAYLVHHTGRVVAVRGTS